MNWSDISLVWVAERATGITALVLLSLSAFLGAVISAGWQSPRFPEIRSVSLHRNISLMTVVFVVIHVVAAIADSFVDVPPVAAFIPFTANYKVLWVGLGTIAFDLLIAIMITSYLRGRINARLWRLIHNLTYLMWAIATVHTLGAAYERSLTFITAALGVALVVPTIILRYTRPHERRGLGEVAQ